jgi:hypothetical protein
VFFLKAPVYGIFTGFVHNKGLVSKVVTEFIPFTLLTAVFGITLFIVLIVIKDENVTYLSDKIARKLKWKK